jgi:carbonic anhydrase/acetyltransferase-like protein (isoleucine patch superfamily)
LIAANALVKAGAVIPDGSMVVGSPGKIIRQTEENIRAYMLAGAQIYVQKAKNMRTELIKVER